MSADGALCRRPKRLASGEDTCLWRLLARARCRTILVVHQAKFEEWVGLTLKGHGRVAAPKGAMASGISVRLTGD